MPQQQVRAADTEPRTGSTTTAGPADDLTFDLGDDITDVDVWIDLSATNDSVEFEVSLDGTTGSWRTHTSIAAADISTGGEFHQFDTSYRHCRVYYDDSAGADADVTLIEASAKGVS